MRRIKQKKNSFAKETYSNRALLQERRGIVRSLLFVCLHIVGRIVICSGNDA